MTKKSADSCISSGQPECDSSHVKASGCHTFLSGPRCSVSFLYPSAEVIPVKSRSASAAETRNSVYDHVLREPLHAQSGGSIWMHSCPSLRSASTVSKTAL